MLFLGKVKDPSQERVFSGFFFGFWGKPDGLKQEIVAWKVLKLLVHERGIYGDFLEEDLMNPELEVQFGVLQKDASSQFGRFPGRALKSVGLPGKEQGGHLQPAPLVGICIWGEMQPNHDFVLQSHLTYIALVWCIWCSAFKLIKNGEASGSKNQLETFLI